MSEQPKPSAEAMKERQLLWGKFCEWAKSRETNEDCTCDDFETGSMGTCWFHLNADERDAERRDGFAEYVLAALGEERDGLKAALDLLVSEDAINGEETLQNVGDWQRGRHCGIEDRGITDRYEACDYGFDCGVERALEWVGSVVAAALAEREPASAES